MKIIYLENNSSYTICTFIKICRTVHLKRMNFILYKLYLNKADKVKNKINDIGLLSFKILTTLYMVKVLIKTVLKD